MKVLWFTNTYLPAPPGKEEDLRGSGGWMNALMAALSTDSRHRYTVVSTRTGKHPKHYFNEGVEAYALPGTGHESASYLKNILAACQEIVDQVQPDIIHVHGTERFYGLLGCHQPKSPCPMVISLQGLLGPYAEWYHYFGNRSMRQILRMHRFIELLVWRGQFPGLLDFRKAAAREQLIVKGNSFFMGRTAWDEAWLHAQNPNARYFHAGELLRNEFWQKRWKLEQAQRYRIIFTNPGHPRKGADILLAAVALLKPCFPAIEVCLAGYLSTRNGYGRYIRKELSKLGATAIALGPLNAAEMAEQLSKSHVFISPSFIDNSPNALCEAQLIGMPVISTYTGGVPSLITEGETGLFFSPGDAPMLAARIRQLFTDDALAIRLGSQSHECARLRHQPARVVDQVWSAYRQVIDSAAIV